MQILFIDESGNTSTINKISDPPIFVLGGVIIPDDFWHKIKFDLDLIRKRHKIKGEIKWRYFAPNHKKANSLSHLSGGEKEKLRQEMYAIINKYKSIRTICIITDVKKAYSLNYINNEDDLYWYFYKQITERFQYYLQDISRISGQKINGIIVCDHRAPKDDKRLQELHGNLLSGDHNAFSSYKNLVEGVFIAPSHLSVGIQFADMVAGAVLRNFAKNDSRFFDQIKETFRKSEDGKIEGFGIIKFPK